jgi:hypothetical protein
MKMVPLYFNARLALPAQESTADDFITTGSTLSSILGVLQRIEDKDYTFDVWCVVLLFFNSKDSNLADELIKL